MKMGLYTAWDEVAKQSGKVFEATNDGIAWRVFEQANKDNPYKEEAHLFSLGTIDKETNQIEAWEPKEIKITDIWESTEENA